MPTPKLTDRPTLTAAVDSSLALIGNTPLVRLTRFEPGLRGEILAKLEMLNPGGSIKDRLGQGLIDYGEEQGFLEPGGTIVEPTAGNTGVGLALVGAQRGYHVILCVPAHFSIEKQKLMEFLGGTVVRTSTELGMKGAIQQAYDIAAEIPGAYVPQQFENPGNPGIHYRTTAAEIWQQADGRIDAIVVGVGSGGTFTGVAQFVRERNPDCLMVAVEPNGSVLQGGEPGPHKVEGIGVSFIPGVLDTDLIDEVIMVHDDDALATARTVARTESLLVGGSSGANCFAALTIARRLGPDKRVVTIFPDSAERYISKGHLDP